MLSYSALLWFACLVIFYMVSVWMEKKAAMRGTHRSPLSNYTDKGLRLFFLFILVAPFCMLSPMIFLPIVLLYLPTYIDEGEKSGQRRSAWFCSGWVWNKISGYFSSSVVSAGGPLDPKKKYIIGVHPHGFLPVATMVSLLTDSTGCQKIFNGLKVRTLAASFCFYVPIYRDIILAGGVIDAARYNARRAIAAGNSIALVPGGATEALYANPGVHKLYLKKRLGFVKLAIEEGCDLVPVYSFGETDCYSQLGNVIPFVKPIQAKFQRIFGLSLPLVTNLWPNKSKITTVFAKPIPVKKNPKPSDAEVQEMLDLYIKRLVEMFDEYAPKYIENPAHRKLEII